MEELKIVMETLTKLGDGAKVAFIVWVLVKYMLYYFTVAGVFFMIIFTAYKIFSPFSSQFSFISRIKGIMGFHGEFLPSEKTAVLDVLRNHKRNEGKTK